MGPVSAGRGVSLRPLGRRAALGSLFRFANWSGVPHEWDGRRCSSGMMRRISTYDGGGACPRRSMLIDDARAGQALLNGAVVLAGEACGAKGGRVMRAAMSSFGGAGAARRPVPLAPPKPRSSSGTRGGFRGGTQATATSPCRRCGRRRLNAVYGVQQRCGQAAPTILGLPIWKLGRFAGRAARRPSTRTREWTPRRAGLADAARIAHDFDFDADNLPLAARRGLIV